MPRRVAEVGEGHEDGNGVYGIIRDLIVEGKDARFVNKKGRYVVNWSRALDCFTDYKAKKNPQFKSKAVSRRKISNGFRSALLNYYKKEGAKEYKDAKKVNENDEVVERQFQMPPRLFKSMFREAGPTITEDSEEDDQEDTSSLVSSEGDDKPEVSRSTSTSDTGFDEFMDMSSHEIVEPHETSLSLAGNFLTDMGLDVIKTEGEETRVGLSDVQLPPASQMFDPSMLDSAIEEICSDGISDDISDEGIDLLGVVQDICPTSGSIKGGFQFYISLTEELPDEVKTGVAQFERVANVMVYKLNPFTLTGTVPPSQVPGEVAVTVVTDAGKKLGMTCFRYIDEMREMVRQIVKDPTLQSLWFAMWSQEHGFFGNDSNIAQVLGPIDLQGQDSSVQTKQQQSVKVLQLLVYTAAQTDAREFIEMVFGTSAGQIVFNSYKDRTPLPEDVALANGHEELAQYLTDINTRLSKETFEDVQSCAIDWLELVKAVQKQSSQDESTKGLQQPSDIDDTSDYFADVETSSCGCSDHDIVWTNMSDNKTAWKCPRGSPILQVIEPCTDEDIFKDVHPVGTTMSENGPSKKCPLNSTNSDETLKKSEESTQRPTTRPVVDKKGTPRKREAQLDNENDKEGVTYGSFTHTFDCISKWWKKKDSGTMAMEQDKCLNEKVKELPSKSRSLFQGLFWRGSDTSEANAHGASGPHMTKPKECHKRPGRATGRSTRKKEAGLIYKGVVLTFALLTVLAGFKLKEGQILHWAVGNGYTQFSKKLLQCGVYVDVPGLLEETPLHLAAKNGFREGIQIAGPLFNNGGLVHATKVETRFHWARKSGPRYTSQFFTQPNEISSRRNENYLPSQLVARNGQHRGVVNVKNSSLQANFLNLASRTGRRQIAESSIRRGIEITAKDIQRQETSFIQQRSSINARICEKDVSPHWAARNESCRLKSSPELVVRRLSQVSVSSVLCHWLKKKFSATSDVISSARRKIPRLRFTRGGGLWNCMNEIDLIFKTQTKSPIFTEKHQQASLGAKDLVDQSLVQSQMSIRKEKLLTHAFSSLSDSESFSSSDRNTSQVLSWYTTVLCVDGKCGKDGINWVLTNNFFVIIGYCVGLCFVFVALNLSFFWRNKQTVCFARHCSILPFLHCITGSEVKCIRTKGLIETKEGDKCVKEAADNGALRDKGRTQTISTKNSASELFEGKLFPEVETFGYQQLNKDKSVRRLRMERVRKWLECNHDQDVLSSVESEVELSPTMSRFSSSTMVKELTIDETVNIEMPESADTVPPMVQSHAVTGSVQETYTAVSCIPCTDEEIFNDVYPVGTTMSENGPSNKCPLKATNSDEKLKKAEESTQRPTTRLLVDKKGTPSKHEAHACTRVPPMAQSHAVTGSLRGTYTAVSCMLCTDEDIFNDVHSVRTTMSENGPSNKCSLQETNSDKKLKKAEESTQRPTTRPVLDKKGTPSKHEAHVCTRVPPMAQSHAVTGSLQGTDTAVSCIPCGHGCYRCHRCEKCSSCGNKDVLVNCSINRVAVCSKSCKSKTHYFNESDGQCYPCTECCGKDKMNIEPVPLKRKEKDSSFFSMSEDSHEPMSFTAGEMRFGQQFQGVTITSSPSELPSSSSPQPPYSNPPAYPNNIGHTSFSLSSATGNRNASISPFHFINTGPYDNSMHRRKKLRLRDWLKEMIDAGLYGLKWEGDPRKRTFRIPWKHGSRHGWSEKDDAALFRAWATYTGKYQEGRDLPDPRKWNTNFRCALNALPDIKEIREESCPRGKDAFKIYKMRPVRGRGK